MEIYKKAIKTELRIQSSRGPLTVEQVNSLKPHQLKNILTGLAEKMQTVENDILSFMGGGEKIDPQVQLAFDVVKDIYVDKVAEENARESMADINREEQELLAIKAEQDNVALRNDPKAVEARLAEIAEKKKAL